MHDEDTDVQGELFELRQDQNKFSCACIIATKKRIACFSIFIIGIESNIEIRNDHLVRSVLFSLSAYFPNTKQNRVKHLNRLLQHSRMRLLLLLL